MKLILLILLQILIFLLLGWIFIGSQKSFTTFWNWRWYKNIPLAYYTLLANSCLTVLYLKPNISWILIQSLGKLPHNFSKYSCKPFKLILTHRWWFWPCLALEMPNLSKNHHFLTWIFKEILYLCNFTDFFFNCKN